MRINLVEVAESAVFRLSGLVDTDGWAAIRTRLCGIFGDTDGGEICDAIEARSVSLRGAKRIGGDLADVEEMVVDRLLTRIESTFEIRRMMAQLDLMVPNQAVGKRAVAVGGSR